ncbi:hypothetical protein ACP275_08G102300 [Erythranthe tilingii]
MAEENPAKESCIRIAEELPVTAVDYINQESWDSFFTSKGTDDFCEWYADWPQFRTSLKNLLSFQLAEELNHFSFPLLQPLPEEVSILVPACGASRLSEHLYDEGFTDITNVDFSKVVIEAMMKRNIRVRPEMKWRVMDITNISFPSGIFDAIVDKGGLDILMDSEHGPRSGPLSYISKVKRLLKAGGRYICLTLAEPLVLDLLFSKFRFGWKINLYTISDEASPGTTTQQTFMLVAEKSYLTVVSRIVPFMDVSFVETQGIQVDELLEALKRENTIREEYSKSTDKWYSLEELKQGVNGNIGVIESGRVIKLFLGETGISRFFYTCVLLDAPPETGPFSKQFLVLFLQKSQASQKILASEFQQRLVLQSFKAARLLIIVLDSSYYRLYSDDIREDTGYFVAELCQVGDDDTDAEFTADDGTIEGIKQNKIVHQVSSVLTGQISVEDVIYNQSQDITFRRLYFERAESLMHSEAPLSTEALRQKKEKPKKIDSHASSGVKVEHKILTTGFHKGVIAGLLLFSTHSKRTTKAGGLVKTVIIGLGPGILPMFMRNRLPSLKIEVVDLDPAVLNVASNYFGFTEDERLKVHITDAIKFVREKANSEADGSKVDLLIIDVDSSDSSSGLISPEADFVEESFLLTVKDSLSDKGLFIFKLIPKHYFTSMRAPVYSKLKRVFSNLYHMYVDDGFVEIIFAVKKEAPVELEEACEALERSLRDNYNMHPWINNVLHDSKLIKPLLLPS